MDKSVTYIKQYFISMARVYLRPVSVTDFRHLVPIDYYLLP
jgi:hypothetical protein